ncbi:TonB-dependent receptor [Altericroceibacterium spongiae]|nr:TonB-dependent receptor [Altericroceibacterium spongiae]
MKTLLWGASLGSLVIAGQVQAQDRANTTDHAALEQDRGQIDTIVVTANRRSESVQDSSLSIAVIGGDDLADAGVSEATDLGSVVPGLTVSLGGGVVQTYMRGVGDFATNANAESAIAYNIDGVYISRPNGIGPIFFDLERVEVLKGPQGTLYGRNATGGAINLITRKPEAGFSGEVSAEIGNYNARKISAAAGGGTETFAVRGAIQYNKHDGYLSDGYNDADSIAGRLIARVRPSETIDLTVMGEYLDMDSQGAATIKRSMFTPVPEDHWEGPSIGNIQQPPTAFIPGGTRIEDDGFNDTKVKAVSAELNVDLGGATVTFLPAYRDTDAAYLTYTPGFYYNTAETSKQTSIELRLANDGEALTWVVGGYFFDEDQTQNYELRAIPIQQSTVSTELGTRAYALFGEATYSISPEFRLIGGLRWSRDEKSQSGLSNAILPTPGQTDNFAERDFEDVSWRAGFEYDVGPENMLFGTAATGYKAGGFFPSVPYPDNSYEPEQLTAFTLGSRNQFLDRTLQLNLEGFYWKYDNKQERFLGATPGGTTGLLTTNAGKATLYGASMDMQFKPTRNDIFHFAVEYLHTKYDRFLYQVYNPSSTAPIINSYPENATSCSLGPVEPYTANDAIPPLQYDSTQSVDCSGKPLVRAPKWTGSMGYQHTFELGGGTVIIAGADGQFSSSQYLSPDFIESGRDNGYLSINADVTLELQSGLSIKIWGRNLTNEAIYTGGGRYAFSRPLAAGGDPTLFYANIRAPRTYGGTVKFRF